MLRTHLKHLFKHSFVYSLGWAASVLAGIIMLPIYSKYLSRADYGAVDLVQQINAVLKIIFMSGLNAAVAKFYHEAETSSAKSCVMSTNIITVTILGLLAGATCYGFNTQLSRYVFGSTDYIYLVNIGAMTVFLDLIYMGLITHYYVAEKSTEFVLLNIVNLFTSIAANLVLVVGYKMGAAGMLYGNLIAFVPVTFIAGRQYIRRYGYAFDFPLLRRMFRFGFPLMPATLLATVMHTADRFLLRAYGSLDQVGLLTMGLNFTSMLNSVLLTSFNSIWMGSIMFKIAKESDSDAQTARISTYFMTVFCCMQAALGIFSTSIMTILVDPKFFISHTVIPITSMGFCFHALYTFITVPAYTKNKTTLMIYAYAIPVIFKITASYFFIGRFGFIGSSFIITGTYAVFAVTCFFLFKKVSPVCLELKRLAILFASCITAMVIAYNLPTTNFIEHGLSQLAIFLGLIAFLWFGPYFKRDEKEGILQEIIKGYKQLRAKTAA